MHSVSISKALCCGLAAGTWLLGGCSFENATNAAYNQASRVGTYLSEDVSFLIGVEKLHCSRIKYDPANDPRFQPASSATHPTLAGSFPDEIPKMNRNIRKFLPEADERAMVITHIVETTRDHSIKFPYNMRELKFDAKDEDAPKRANEIGLGALSDVCQKSIPAALAKGRAEGRPFSHVLVMTMGWVNDQQESVMRFRAIAGQMRKAAAARGDKSFRPLVVGISWPSGWLTNSDSPVTRAVGHIGSYFNKANDADELGYRILSPLIHHYLPKAVPDSTPIIAIGHSFGARALSRAVHSGCLLTQKPGRNVDMLIALQPAVSMRRWVPGIGVEGAPYATDEKFPEVIVSSSNDHANEIAFWAINGGQKAAIDLAKERPDRFQSGTWDKDAWRINPAPNWKGLPVVVDASEIVRENQDFDPFGSSKNPRSGHNDVLDYEMGKLVYFAIKQVK